MATGTTRRRTQAERSAATSAALLEATLTTLADLGYHGATTGEIARRAGVSRGAMLHHYPTRDALLAAAAEWMVESRIAEFRRAMAGIGDRADRLRAAVDLLWRICSSPAHSAWIELGLAARHEPHLAEVVGDLQVRMRERVRATWAETFPELQHLPRAGHAPDFALALLEGLAVTQLVAPDPAAAAAVLGALGDVADLLLDPTPIPTETP